MSKKHPIPKQYLGAFKAGHRASAREFIDEELSFKLLDKIIKSNYTDQKSMDELAYITKFNNEFHKNVVKKDDPEALHNTEELRKDLYDRENSRNRDIMSVERHKMVSLEPKIAETEGGQMYMDAFLNSGRDLFGQEDAVIELMDRSDEIEKAIKTKTKKTPKN